jgi:hypothetical protein
VVSDTDGRYQALVRLGSTRTTDLMVQASHANSKSTGRAMVGSWSAVDRVIVAPMIDSESGLSADVYLRMITSGIDVSRFGLASVRRMLSPRMASELSVGNDYERALPEVTRSTLAAVNAWRRVLTSSGAGVKPESVLLALDALDWAQVMLDAELYAAESQDEQDKAHADYAMLTDAAYASAGITPEHLAVAAQASADAMRFHARSTSGRLRSTIISEAEGLRARYVTSAVESLVTRTGAGEEDRRAIHDAGLKLETAIFTAIEAGSRIDEMVKAAWVDYRRFVITRLQAMAAENRGQSVM